MNLGSRIGMWSGDAKMPTAKDYVQDGLISMWDGIENAGWGVHNTLLKSWPSLVGNAVLSPVGLEEDFVWSGNCLSFTGGTTYLRYDKVQIPRGTSSSVRLIFNLRETSFSGWGSVANVDNSFYIATIPPYYSLGMAFGGRRDYVVRIDTNNNPDHFVCVNDIESGVSKMFRNGKLISEIYGKEAATYYTNQTAIGRSLGVNKAQNIYAYMVYNRAITEKEVESIYAIDKARFGLP